MRNAIFRSIESLWQLSGPDGFVLVAWQGHIRKLLGNLGTNTSVVLCIISDVLDAMNKIHGKEKYESVLAEAIKNKAVTLSKTADGREEELDPEKEAVVQRLQVDLRVFVARHKYNLANDMLEVLKDFLMSGALNVAAGTSSAKDAYLASVIKAFKLLDAANNWLYESLSADDRTGVVCKVGGEKTI